MQTSLAEAWEQIHVLLEKVDELDLQQTATLIALAKTAPSFALEYERAYKAIAGHEKNSENELPPNVRELFHRLRNRLT
ncbi:hypothetical protein SBA1_340038 [Candidatus Sulfotelmatobacter kueseliae]|uniref:Uncharacterized protein n=1 Tax=Candidatus Sulfotelmatobacter kueseliae TaxID=2042962 RepID=A0A2U3KN52_9BACT|nr:hypothetical protein SBA1_340038 [Candidatus Sulfotelmatobacter kueseliae]